MFYHPLKYDLTSDVVVVVGGGRGDGSVQDQVHQNRLSRVTQEARVPADILSTCRQPSHEVRKRLCLGMRGTTRVVLLFYRATSPIFRPHRPLALTAVARIHDLLMAISRDRQLWNQNF